MNRVHSAGAIVVAAFLIAGSAIADSGAAAGTGRTIGRTVLAKAAVEDLPGHELVQSVGLQELTTPDPIAGVSFQGAQMRTQEQADLVAGSGLVRGYGVWESPSGHKLFLSYGYSVPPFSDPSLSVVPIEGSFEWIGGTGPLADVRGHGAIEGEMSRSGLAKFRWNATYQRIDR